MKRIAFSICLLGLLISVRAQVLVQPGEFEVLAFSDGGIISPAQFSKDGLKLYYAVADSSGPSLYAYYRKKTKKPFKKKIRIDVQLAPETVDFFQPSFTEDGNYLVFSGQTSEESGWNDNELYLSERIGDHYGNTRILDEINRNGYADAYPWISSDGLRLFYTMDEHIQFTSRESADEVFNKPRKLDLGADENETITSCWLNIQETEIYYIRGTYIYQAVRLGRDSDFGEPILFMDGLKDLEFISGLSFTPDMKQMVIYYSGEEMEIRLYKLGK